MQQSLKSSHFNQSSCINLEREMQTRQNRKIYFHKCQHCLEFSRELIKVNLCYRKIHVLFLINEVPGNTMKLHTWKSSKLKSIVPLSFLRLCGGNYEVCKLNPTVLGNTIFELTMLLFFPRRDSNSQTHTLLNTLYIYSSKPLYLYSEP